MEQERESSAALVFQKVSVKQYTGCSGLDDYLAKLTPYAFTKVREQCDLSKKLVFELENDKDEVIINGFKSSTHDCSCSFRTIQDLHCK